MLGSDALQSSLARTRRVRSRGEGNVDPATLWTVWRNVNGSWKVVSYALLNP